MLALEITDFHPVEGKIYDLADLWELLIGSILEIVGRLICFSVIVSGNSLLVTEPYSAYTVSQAAVDWFLKRR